ncbi:unnamed protein product [Discula destructiva]
MGYTYSPLVEMWSLYAAGSLIIYLRIACRWKLVGLQGFKPDDFLIVLSWIIYTVMSIAAHICGSPDIHSLPHSVRASLTEEEAKPYVWVTQWFCAGVATYICFIWSLKVNMLFFYQRVVNGLWVSKFIIPTMTLVGCTLVTTITILFASCRPYPKMWIVWPDQGANCEPQAPIYMIPALIMNVLTDVLIMAIPAPVVLPVKTTFRRKVSLIILFGAGVFVIVAAILRVTMVLVQQNGATAAIWSCREDFVAICIGQAPILRPAFSKGFWTGEMCHSTSRSTPGSIPLKSGNDTFEMGSSRKRTKGDDYNVTIMSTRPRGDSDGESTERIIEGSIMVNTWVHVDRESNHFAESPEAKQKADPYDRI